jgi:diguanylate cyclase (GGDEF)-like protein
LRLHTARARAILARLQQNIVSSGSSLGDYASLLIETNQQLVLSALDAQMTASASLEELADLRKESQAAQHDALTELPTRLLLQDRFAYAIATARRRGTRLALMFLDLDNFKQINDTLGHAAGDQVLKRVAQCLATAVRGADTVSRHGGDEFLVLLAEVSEPADALLIADKVLAALSAPTPVDDHLLALSASIGISLYPDHGDDMDLLIHRADNAMYHAKRHGLGSFVYQFDTPGVDSSAAEPPSEPASDFAHASADNSPHTELREVNERLMLSALSNQEQLALAEQTYQRQAEFLAVLAHELRNPLGPIRSAAAMLGHIASEGNLLFEIKVIIERQVVHLTRLIGDLLDMSRADSGKLRLEPERIDLAKIIVQVMEGTAAMIAARQQTLLLTAPATTIAIDGDPLRLTQIINNLLSNASKYTPSGGAIGLKVALQEKNVILSVSDNGIGISADVLPYIFKPFVQDPHATRFNHDGMGIGLAVVRELVQGHGGTVIATSGGPGRGSEFTVTLPRFLSALH